MSVLELALSLVCCVVILERKRSLLLCSLHRQVEELVLTQDIRVGDSIKRMGKLALSLTSGIRRRAIPIPYLGRTVGLSLDIVGL